MGLLFGGRHVILIYWFCGVCYGLKFLIYVKVLKLGEERWGEDLEVLRGEEHH